MSSEPVFKHAEEEFVDSYYEASEPFDLKVLDAEMASLREEINELNTRNQVLQQENQHLQPQLQHSEAVYHKTLVEAIFKDAREFNGTVGEFGKMRQDEINAYEAYSVRVTAGSKAIDEIDNVICNFMYHNYCTELEENGHQFSTLWPSIEDGLAKVFSSKRKRSSEHSQVEGDVDEKPTKKAS